MQCAWKRQVEGLGVKGSQVQILSARPKKHRSNALLSSELIDAVRGRGSMCALMGSCRSVLGPCRPTVWTAADERGRSAGSTTPRLICRGQGVLLVRKPAPAHAPETCGARRSARVGG